MTWQAVFTQLYSPHVSECRSTHRTRVRHAVTDVASSSAMCVTLLGGEPRELRGRAVQVDPMKPNLRAPGTQRFKLKHG
jgi:hypothetical protein